jgi:class 3 adenylate cyclase
MPTLPSGTVTFAFSDIEGSTSLLKRLGDADYATLLATHRRLMREIFDAFNGQEIDTQGDAFFYSFVRAREAVAAAVDVQRAHREAKWPQGVEVRVRIGLHTGEPAVGDEGYTGLDVVRASRMAATGQGGQVLLSDTTRAIVADALPDGVSIRSLGQRTLRDIDRPEPISELVIPGVTATDGAAAEETEPAAAEEAWPDRSAGQPSSWPFETGADGTSEVPDWVRRAALRLLPSSGGPGRDLIEQRVLSALDGAFAQSAAKRAERDRRREEQPEERATRRAERGADPDATSPAGGVAAEIERLQRLRDSGALTDEQYARAVDRVLGS